MDVVPNTQQLIRASALAQDLRALLGKLKRRLREQAHVGDLTPSQVSVLLAPGEGRPGDGVEPCAGGGHATAVDGLGHRRAGGRRPGERRAGPDRRTADPALAHGRLPQMGRGRARSAPGLADPHSPGASFAARNRTKLAEAVELLKRLVDD